MTCPFNQKISNCNDACVLAGKLLEMWLLTYGVNDPVVNMLQVEDVDGKFSELDKLKAADWVVARQTPVKPKPTKVNTVCSFVNSLIDFKCKSTLCGL